jgi:hypothetical protein
MELNGQPYHLVLSKDMVKLINKDDLDKGANRYTIEALIVLQYCELLVLTVLLNTV